jgi:hypothetical protein
MVYQDHRDVLHQERQLPSLSNACHLGLI